MRIKNLFILLFFFIIVFFIYVSNPNESSFNDYLINDAVSTMGENHNFPSEITKLIAIGSEKIIDYADIKLYNREEYYLFSIYTKRFDKNDVYIGILDRFIKIR